MSTTAESHYCERARLLGEIAGKKVIIELLEQQLAAETKRADEAERRLAGLLELSQSTGWDRLIIHESAAGFVVLPFTPENEEMRENAGDDSPLYKKSFNEAIDAAMKGD